MNNALPYGDDRIMKLTLVEVVQKNSLLTLLAPAFYCKKNKTIQAYITVKRLNTTSKVAHNLRNIKIEASLLLMFLASPHCIPKTTHFSPNGPSFLNIISPYTLLSL